MKGLLVFLVVWGAVPVGAQFYYYDDRYMASEVVVEMGVAAGGMNGLTDLGGRRGSGKKFIGDLNPECFRSCFGLFVTVNYREAVGIRMELSRGSLESFDSILAPVAANTFGRYERNLSFRSRIGELQLVFEIHPLLFRHYDESQAPYFSPYVIGGAAVFTFDPQAFMDGQWHYLQPLHTEGQGFGEYPGRKLYRLTQINIPLGIGVRYEAAALWSLRLEILHRFLFTDYLDDVSQEGYVDPVLFEKYLPPGLAATARKLYFRGQVQAKGTQRGNPDNRDSYFTIQFKVSLNLRRRRAGH